MCAYIWQAFEDRRRVLSCDFSLTAAADEEVVAPLSSCLWSLLWDCAYISELSEQ